MTKIVGYPKRESTVRIKLQNLCNTMYCEGRRDQSDTLARQKYIVKVLVGNKKLNLKNFLFNW